MKKLFLLMLSLVAMSASAQEGIIQDGISYNFNADASGTYLYVTEVQSSVTGSVVIPASVDFAGQAYPVKIVKAGAIRCPYMTSITFNKNLTTIEEKAFVGCDKLDEITFNSPTFVSSDFQSLGLTGRFNGHKPSKITFGEGVTAIGDGFANGYVDLTEVVYPESLQTIGASAFRGCTGLVSINLPSSLTAIGAYAFCGCSALTSISISESVETLGEQAFANCTALTKVYVYRRTPYAYNKIFSNELTSGKRTLYVVKGSKSAYEQAEGWKDAFDEIAEVYPQADGFSYDIISETEKTCTIVAAIKGEYPGDIVIPETLDGYKVVAIADRAFEGTPITSIIIPESVKSIGNTAFSNCSSLTSAKLPEGLKEISAYLFNRCSALTEVNIPAGVTSIGQSAFFNCNALKTIAIPKGVTEIGQAAFTTCSSLEFLFVGIKTPLEVGNMTFRDATGATLIVPYGTKEAYEQADYWKNFASIVEMPATDDESKVAEDVNGDGQINSLDALKVYKYMQTH